MKILNIKLHLLFDFSLKKVEEGVAKYRDLHKLDTIINCNVTKLESITL